jgi:hypothetical protein
MRMVVESAEVATLKADGRPWDGPGCPALPQRELAAHFALDLTAQLERLVTVAGAPTPPDVFVRVHVGADRILETRDQKSFDPTFRPREGDELPALPPPGTELRVEVWDRDVLFNDLIGEVRVLVPDEFPNGRWRIGPFGQVRAVVIAARP